MNKKDYKNISLTTEEREIVSNALSFYFDKNTDNKVLCEKISTIMVKLVKDEVDNQKSFLSSLHTDKEKKSLELIKNTIKSLKEDNQKINLLQISKKSGLAYNTVSKFKQEINLTFALHFTLPLIAAFPGSASGFPALAVSLRQSCPRHRQTAASD